MNIYLMRHFKVNFNWKKKYSSKEFKIACEEYDNSNIVIQNTEFDSKDIQQIYISNLIRSNLTYKALKIEIKANKKELINEVPIAPFVNTNLKLPIFIWMTFGRIQWLLNIKQQPETKRDTLKKIKSLINLLEEEKKDTLIIGHGFYFSQLKRELKKNKYSGKRKLYFKNGEIVKFIKLFR